MLKSYTSADLLKRIAVDDIKAFEEIYRRYTAKMLSYALNILKDKVVCEDIIQNIFIDFWSKRKEHTIQNLEGYLFRAVKFQVFKHFRDKKFSTEDLTRLNLIEVAVNASKTLEYTELETAIHNSVLKLPPRCKQVFELSRYEHKTHKEIADTLGISVQAVKNQVTKALSFIKEHLKNDEHILFFLLLFGYHF